MSVEIILIFWFHLVNFSLFEIHIFKFEIDFHIVLKKMHFSDVGDSSYISDKERKKTLSLEIVASSTLPFVFFFNCQQKLL